MEKEKIDKVVGLCKKKEALESLFKNINRTDICLLVNKKGAGYNSNYLSTSDTCTAQPYLEELIKRFVVMVTLDISDIETELETL